MVRAASRGVDFSSARAGDRNWRRKLDWTLDALEDEAVGQVLTLRHARACAAMASAKSDEQMEKSWEAATKMEESLCGMLLPWVNRDRDRRTVIRQMSDTWKSIFGDPTDPAVQKRIEQTVSVLRARAARAKGRKR